MILAILNFLGSAVAGRDAALSHVWPGARRLRSCQRLCQCLAYPVMTGFLALLLPGFGFAAVDGKALDAAAEHYRPFMIASIDQSLAEAAKLHQCLVAKDIACARRAWIAARVGWERSEVFTSSLAPELDRKIDAWPDAADGFHGIESALFGAGGQPPMAEVEELLADLKAFKAKMSADRLPAQALFNGTARLAYEIGGNKADGGESRLSGTSLEDMRNNVTGIEAAYDTIFSGALKQADPKLADRAKREIDQLKNLLAAPDLKAIDPEQLRMLSETFVVTLAEAAPKLGLVRPLLEEIGK
ncbi:EfeM/EfeO family lipoprotein [Beijerinckia mobilis]|uniref:EfeM/EfeO family lipoprotein n=1 Tax=Beijerinckia mobilis TaxID=231434 RepID=UPI00068FB216|nr:EfeM/EfeO family lipoprotein [Beijerinckia mobilis]